MSLESEWHAMPEVRDRALRHAADQKFIEIDGRWVNRDDWMAAMMRPGFGLLRHMPPPYFWLGAEAECF